jgi:hypothetical protein
MIDLISVGKNTLVAARQAGEYVRPFVLPISAACSSVRASRLSGCVPSLPVSRSAWCAVEAAE